MRLFGALVLVSMAACADYGTQSHARNAAPAPSERETAFLLSAGQQEWQAAWAAIPTAERRAGLAAMERVYASNGLAWRSFRIGILLQPSDGSALAHVVADPEFPEQLLLVLPAETTNLQSFSRAARAIEYLPRAALSSALSVGITGEFSRAAPLLDAERNEPPPQVSGWIKRLQSHAVATSAVRIDGIGWVRVLDLY